MLSSKNQLMPTGDTAHEGLCTILPVEQFHIHIQFFLTLDWSSRFILQLMQIANVGVAGELWLQVEVFLFL